MKKLVLAVAATGMLATPAVADQIQFADIENSTTRTNITVQATTFCQGVFGDFPYLVGGTANPDDATITPVCGNIQGDSHIFGSIEMDDDDRQVLLNQQWGPSASANVNAQALAQFYADQEAAMNAWEASQAGTSDYPGDGVRGNRSDAYRAAIGDMNAEVPEEVFYLSDMDFADLLNNIADPDGNNNGKSEDNNSPAWVAPTPPGEGVNPEGVDKVEVQEPASLVKEMGDDVSWLYPVAPGQPGGDFGGTDGEGSWREWLTDQINSGTPVGQHISSGAATWEKDTSVDNRYIIHGPGYKVYWQDGNVTVSY